MTRPSKRPFGVDLYALFTCLAVLALIGWSVDVHSKLVGVVILGIYVIWLVAGSALLVWRRYKPRGKDRGR